LFILIFIEIEWTVFLISGLVAFLRPDVCGDGFGGVLIYKQRDRQATLTGFPGRPAPASIILPFS
jgi:hypothetical protein